MSLTASRIGVSRAMRRGALGIGVMLLLGAACASAFPSPQEPLGPVPVLNELGGVDQFKARFNEDGGVQRVILRVIVVPDSPTL